MPADLPGPDPQTQPQSAPQSGLDLAMRPGERVEIDLRVGAGGLVTRQVRRFSRPLETVRAAALSPAWLSGIALAAALLVHLVGLARYPAHFTPAEAVSSVRAYDLINSGLRGVDGTFLPAFFPGERGPAGLGGTVYFQVLPQLLGFGSLVWVRLWTGLLCALAGFGLAYAASLVYRLTHGWAIMLLLAGLPAWYFFARTGLEYAQAAALAACGLAAYALYRAGRPRFLLLAVFLAGLAFYAAPALRLAVPLALAGLGLSDASYHWRNRRVLLAAFGLGLLLALPLILTLATRPDLMRDQLAAQGSFWVEDLPAGTQWGRFAGGLLAAFNPLLWFGGSAGLPAAYRMDGLAPLPFWLLPLILLGGWRALRSWRSWEFRLVLIVLLAGAAGAAVAPFGLPDLLALVPPLAMLAVVGLHDLLNWLARRWKGMPAWLPGGLVLVLLSINAAGLGLNALVNGPGWERDYGRDGLQFGAPQVMAAVGEYARLHRGQTVLVSPEWTRDLDLLLRFFLPRATNVQPGTTEAFLREVRPDLASQAFLLTADELEQVRASGKVDLTLHAELAYPDGSPGFALASLAYREDIEQALAREAALRRELVAGLIELEGRDVVVRHSRLDMGSAANLFDGDPSSLARSATSNPLVVELYFALPRTLSGVRVRAGAEPVALTVSVLAEGAGEPVFYSAQAGRGEDYKTVGVDFGQPVTVSQLRIELLDIEAGEPAHVHLWEVELVDAP